MAVPTRTTIPPSSSRRSRPSFLVTAASVILLVAVLGGDLCHAKVQRHKVRCTDEEMQVEVVAPDDAGDIYLEQLQHYPDPACRATRDGSRATFTLSLRDIFQCGVTRVANQATGRRVFYHRVVIEGPGNKEVLLVKCVLSALPHDISKRNVLPAGFQEPEFLEITTNLTEKAPEPVLGVGVRQGGSLVTGELNVNPGTPLQMEIFLDKGSAPIYGLLVSYMQVTDTKAQEETIIFNGCSVDPYLFENFNTVDGDFLTAKFRAFKFPESTYVQFKGTVNVCLDKCRGVECSNGKTGYGRKRREVSGIPADPNKVFEVTMTTFLKVDYLDGKLLDKATFKAGAVVMPTTGNHGNGSTGEADNHVSTDSQQRNQNNLKLDTEEIREELEYKVFEQAESTATTATSIPKALLALLAITMALASSL